MKPIEDAFLYGLNKAKTDAPFLVAVNGLSRHSFPTGTKSEYNKAVAQVALAYRIVRCGKRAECLLVGNTGAEQLEICKDCQRKEFGWGTKKSGPRKKL